MTSLNKGERDATSTLEIVMMPTLRMFPCAHAAGWISSSKVETSNNSLERCNRAMFMVGPPCTKNQSSILWKVRRVLVVAQSIVSLRRSDTSAVEGEADMFPAWFNRRAAEVDRGLKIALFESGQFCNFL